MPKYATGCSGLHFGTLSFRKTPQAGKGNVERVDIANGGRFERVQRSRYTAQSHHRYGNGSRAAGREPPRNSAVLERTLSPHPTGPLLGPTGRRLEREVLTSEKTTTRLLTSIDCSALSSLSACGGRALLVPAFSSHRWLSACPALSRALPLPTAGTGRGRPALETVTGRPGAEVRRAPPRAVAGPRPSGGRSRPQRPLPSGRCALSPAPPCSCAAAAPPVREARAAAVLPGRGLRGPGGDPGEGLAPGPAFPPPSCAAVRTALARFVSGSA